MPRASTGTGRSRPAKGDLSAYRHKRDAAKTPEPVPGDGPLPAGNDDTFVIQEHHARRLHWDFRLERGGVLVSWAVPKGLPLDPKTNHLAVHTEDHPMEYAAFAGEIPKGEYGGGQVTIWDRGTYETEKWSDREVMVVLHGSRVSGKYVLFKTDGDNWMVHRMDPPPSDFAALPSVIKPMLAVARDQLPRDDDKWGYEFKWDGVRAVVYVESGRARALSRNDNDVTGSYPELRALGEALASHQVVLDGELVALDEAGRPSFSALQPRMHVTSPAQVARLVNTIPVIYFAFDVLHLDGESLIDTPYAERRQILEDLNLSGTSWQTPPWFDGEGAAVLAAARAQKLEGVVAKRLDSRYSPGRRSDHWLKVKLFATQEVVIGGWKPGEGRRAGTLGSLLLGVQEKDGLHYAGHVGSGFTDAMLRDLSAELGAIERPDPPFADTVPREHARNAHWVEPRIVGEVAYGEWTREGRLRHPAWRGLRPDKDPSEVVREQ